MGRYKVSGTEIENYIPDNDENTLFVESGFTYGTIDNLLDSIKEHFGEDVKLSDLHITAEHIHTSCLGYDRYDPGDYTNYIKVEKINS